MPSPAELTGLGVLALLLVLIWKQFLPKLMSRHEQLVKDIMKAHREVQAKAEETNRELAARCERMTKEMLDRFDAQLQTQRQHDNAQHDRILEELRAMRLQSREDQAAYRADMRALIEALHRASPNGRA